ncbi:hypothetical protein RQP46_005141 [Phenoliferia psychrophenolica]
MSLVQDLKRQFGLVKDPDRVVIIPATETLPKLTRTITKNDNDQPGFPVFHRHTFASPFVAGNDEADLTAAQQRKPASTGSDMLCLPAGIGSTIAGLWFYPLGNTWGLSLYTLLGGVLISFAMADIPWTGIAAAYVGGAATPGEGALMFANALGILGMIAMLLIAMTGIASLKTSIPVTSSIIIVNVGLVLSVTLPVLQLRELTLVVAGSPPLSSTTSMRSQ